MSLSCFSEASERTSEINRVPETVRLAILVDQSQEFLLLRGVGGVSLRRRRQRQRDDQEDRECQRKRPARARRTSAVFALVHAFVVHPLITCSNVSATPGTSPSRTRTYVCTIESQYRHMVETT